MYNLILDKFEPGISYTDEHLEIFIEEAKLLLQADLNLTTQKLANILNNLFKIESRRPKVESLCPTIDNLFLYNIMPIPGHDKKRIRIYTIIRPLTVDDLAEELHLNEIDIRVLTKYIDDKVSRVGEQIELLDFYDLGIFA